MTTRRTCSYTPTLIAVSWRVSYAVTPDVLADIEVVADALLSRPQVAALLTVRLLECNALAKVYVGARLLASYDLSRSMPETNGILGSLFRPVVPLPAGLVDGRTHMLTMVVERAVDDRATIATIESAFYARPASNRRLAAEIST
jgi:hypothetical protein